MGECLVELLAILENLLVVYKSLLHFVKLLHVVVPCLTLVREVVDGSEIDHILFGDIQVLLLMALPMLG